LTVRVLFRPGLRELIGSRVGRIVDPLDLQVSEFCKIGEFDVSLLGNPNANGSIVIDAPAMQLGWQGCKILLDVLAIGS